MTRLETIRLLEKIKSCSLVVSEEREALDYAISVLEEEIDWPAFTKGKDEK